MSGLDLLHNAKLSKSTADRTEHCLNDYFDSKKVSLVSPLIYYRFKTIFERLFFEKFLNKGLYWAVYQGRHDRL